MAYYKLKFTKEAGQVHRQQEMNNFSDTNQAESSNSRENKGRGLSQEEVEELVGGMFKNAGVAITVTTLTDVLAFGISASSNYISVRTFCIYTGRYLTLQICVQHSVSFNTKKSYIVALNISFDIKCK